MGDVPKVLRIPLIRQAEFPLVETGAWSDASGRPQAVLVAGLCPRATPAGTETEIRHPLLG